MTSRWRSSFGRAACVLGLALMTQFAGQFCLAVSALAHSVENGRALESSAQLKSVAVPGAADECRAAACSQPAVACAADSARVELGIAAASPSADYPPFAATEYISRIAGPAGQVRFSPGLTPGFRSPLYIRFGRYLS